jgi:hypothetical protein
MRVLPGLVLISCVVSCAPATEDEPTGRRPASNNDDDDDDGNEGEGESGEGEGENVPPPGACLDAGCPTILTLSANTTTFTPSTTIVISAVVTDPDGIDDLIGGVLLDPVTNATYGAFQTSAAEGAYELRLGWDEVNTTRAIDFAASASRPLRARFFDQAGHETLQDLTVTLTCEGPAACAGVCNEVRCGDVCVDDSFVDDDHCGRCDVACPSQLRCVDEDPITRDSIEPTCLCADNVSTSAHEFDRCGDTCVDFGEDEDNCGACGRQCGADQQCYSGSCSCDSAQEDESCTSPEGAGTCYNAEIEPGLHGYVCLALGAGRLVEGENARDGFLEVEVDGAYHQVCTGSISSHPEELWCSELFGTSGVGENRSRELPTWGFAYDCRTSDVSDCTVDTFGLEVYGADCPFPSEPLYVTCD